MKNSVALNRGDKPHLRMEYGFWTCIGHGERGWAMVRFQPTWQAAWLLWTCGTY